MIFHIHFTYLLLQRRVLKRLKTLAASSATVLDEVNKEMLEVARRSNPSVLGQRGYDGMSAEDWMSNTINELLTRTVVYSILCSLLERDFHPKKKSPTLCLIYAVIMFLWCHELSQIQRINTVLLIQGKASVNVSVNEKICHH